MAEVAKAARVRMLMSCMMKVVSQGGDTQGQDA